MKFLRKFETESDYNSYSNGSNFITPNVSHMVELAHLPAGDPRKAVMFNPYVEPQKAGDIVYYVNDSLKTIGYAKWDASLGTPIGVITIPEGFAPDGKARMIALSGQTSITWISAYTDYTDTSVTNYNRVPTTDNAGATTTSSARCANLPSDKFTGTTSYVDSVTKYYGSTTMIPSPYAGDAPNPEYYKEISGYNNALSDFSGLENTYTLVELDSANYQAANHCWTYNDGVSTTQWYLPACGELGYMMPRFNEIQAGLAAVSAVQLGSSYDYWSSSECSSSDAYLVGAFNGDVENSSKRSSGYARPWAIVE